MNERRTDTETHKKVIQKGFHLFLLGYDIRKPLLESQCNKLRYFNKKHHYTLLSVGERLITTTIHRNAKYYEKNTFAQ